MTQGQEQSKMVKSRHERSSIPFLSRPLWSTGSTRNGDCPELPIAVNKIQQRLLFSVPTLSIETSSSTDEYDSTVDSETEDDEFDLITREQLRRLDDEDDDIVVNVFRNITGSVNNKPTVLASFSHDDEYSDDEYEENDGDIWTLKRAHPILEEGSESEEDDNESTGSILDKTSTTGFQSKNVIADTSVYTNSSNTIFVSPKKKQRRDDEDDDDENQSFDSQHNDRFVIPPSPVTTTESSVDLQEQPVNLCYKYSGYELS